MKSSLQNYTVPFTGLKDGSHQLSFEIGREFFEKFEYSLIESGEVVIDVILEKNPTMITTFYSIKGTVDTICDRCNDPLNVKIAGEFKLVFKFGREESLNEELIVLPPEAYELEFAPFLYEFINVSLPIKKVHGPGLCNEEMVELIGKYSINQEESEYDDDDEFDDDFDDDDDFDWENEEE
jgi:uncharacterized protein